LRITCEKEGLFLKLLRETESSELERLLCVPEPPSLHRRILMTIDKSLRIKAGSTKQRNVLSRAERLQTLAATDRWMKGDPVLGMPKVRVEKISVKKKKKAKKGDEEGEEGAAPAATTEKSAGKS
jgi:small basic protein (TIGR04137 family)